MNPNMCFLITVLYESEQTLLKCALKVDKDTLPGDCIEYPMETENRKYLHSLLPEHVKSCGPIVDVEDLFEIHCN